MLAFRPYLAGSIDTGQATECKIGLFQRECHFVGAAR